MVALRIPLRGRQVLAFPPFWPQRPEIEILATFTVDFRRKKKYGEDLAMGLLWVSNQVI